MRWSCSTASTRRISSGRSPHDALDALAAGIERSKVNWVPGRGHPRLLRPARPSLAGAVPRAPDRGQADSAADPEMIGRRGYRRRAVVEDRARDRARSVSFAAALPTSDAARSPAGPGSPAAPARGQGAARGSQHTDSLVELPPRATRHRQPCSAPSTRCDGSRADASTATSAGRNRRRILIRQLGGSPTAQDSGLSKHETADPSYPTSGL
jgi:hypothetical protein